MRRVLLDENVPVAVRTLIGGHEVFTVQHQGRKGLTNGRLMDAAEAAGFEVLVTADQNLRFQQKVAGRSLALLILPATTWRELKNAGRAIELAIERVPTGGCENVPLGTTSPGAK